MARVPDGEGDLRDSLRRRLRSALLTGIPFGIFKIGGGLAASEDIQAVAGIAIIVWGGLDVLLNVLWTLDPRHFAPCLLSLLARRLERGGVRPGVEQLMLAVDTLLAFAIVSTMIWFGRIALLPPMLVRLWELSVIANILGVGGERVWSSWRRLRGPGSGRVVAPDG